MTDQEVDELGKHYGNANWIEDTYLRFSGIGIIEYTLFAISLVLMTWYLLY
jgi:hypothetical protein